MDTKVGDFYSGNTSTFWANVGIVYDGTSSHIVIATMTNCLEFMNTANTNH